MNLCGEKYFRPFDIAIKAHIQAFISISSTDGLNYEQFNELLLLFDQDRMGRAFFDFLFDSNGLLKLDDLPACIARFRGFAMLAFGEFRFAYKKLSCLNEAQLAEALDPYSKPPQALL